MIYGITNSVTGQIEQLVDSEYVNDVLAFLNASDAKDGGETVRFEAAEYVPPELPPEPPSLLDEG